MFVHSIALDLYNTQRVTCVTSKCYRMTTPTGPDHTSQMNPSYIPVRLFQKFPVRRHTAMNDSFSLLAVYMQFIFPSLGGLCYFVPMMYKFILYWYCMCAWSYHFLCKGLRFLGSMGRGDQIILTRTTCVNHSAIATDVTHHLTCPWLLLLSPLLDGVGWMKCVDQQLAAGGGSLIQARPECANQRGKSHSPSALPPDLSSQLPVSCLQSFLHRLVLCSGQGCSGVGVRKIAFALSLF